MRQSIGDKKTIVGGAAAPTGDVGLELSGWVEMTSRPTKWLLTVVVTVGTATTTLWGCTPAGVPDDSTDDVWGIYNDMHGRVKNGDIGGGAALAVGTHHFIVDHLGIFSRVYVQFTGAGTVAATLAPVYQS